MRRALLALLTAPALLAGCAAGEEEGADVLATFYPLAYATERIVGDAVSVGTLVPAGVEPHDWEPDPTDVARLADARLLVQQGAGFEPWLDGLVANLGADAPTLVDSTAGLTLAPSEDADEPGLDPHTWLDPTLYARQAQAIETALAAAFPEHADGFRARGDALRAELEALDAELEIGLATCEVDLVIANHDAYGYLARRYGFTVEAISGLSPEAEPSPEDLARVIDVAREHNITIVFFEELVSPRVAEVVAEEVGAQTRVLSPIEGAADGKDYLALMRENLVHLREAMRCT